ncbi:TRAF family member-associated NF-kappa-B activator isoform X2 [Spea bombifrons]|uniref:TRAF family member-associated NF-kappa-B activator isoform X2 n=1 Tax=Spea bombifrons TaxID=233779 RepID=UPI00234926A5|nr:TRAF family member-associated NF-kappa-B activator isoform X2 [Spea bombifrons]
MDKIGDQLNKAYEAYRQVCVEKERFKKDLTMKTELYEQQIRDQNNQILQLKGWIAELKAQLQTFTGQGFSPGPPPSPKNENAECRRTETVSNLSYEQLQEQLTLSKLQKMHYKEQLEIEHLKSKKMEEEQKKLESILLIKNEEIRALKNLLKEERTKKNTQEFPPVRSPLDESTRQGAEQLFCDLKDEFSRICKLTREQSLRLNRFFKKENGADVPMQFSMPVQCTDETNDKTQAAENPKFQKSKAAFASITPRGLGPDDELSVSVESLSNLSVKFPPSDENCEFLESSPEIGPLLRPASDKNAPHDALQKEAPLFPMNFDPIPCGSSGKEPLTGTVSDLMALRHLNIRSNYKNSYLDSEKDDSASRGENSPLKKYTVDYFIQGLAEGSEPSTPTGRTVRGPQQAIWKPSKHEENDLIAPGCEKWDQDSADICEFCQAVFPPSSRTSGDFLRHLNSHFNGQS